MSDNTVQSLIKELKKYDPKHKVEFYTGPGEKGIILSIYQDEDSVVFDIGQSDYSPEVEFR